MTFERERHHNHANISIYIYTHISTVTIAGTEKNAERGLRWRKEQSG